MSLMRSMLLSAARNSWLRQRASKYRLVKRSVSRFMPGETIDEALVTAQELQFKKIGMVFTHLGENIQNHDEAKRVTEHYLEVLDRIHTLRLPAEISVKLTQLGLDLSPELCYENLCSILVHQQGLAHEQGLAIDWAREQKDVVVWIDMEGSNYVDATLGIYRRALQSWPNVGVCVQAYLRRTREDLATLVQLQDLATLLPLRPSIRLVKGAYNEPPEIAFPRKQDVDENYSLLAQELLLAKKHGRCRRAAFGTHDVRLIRRISEFAAGKGFAKSEIEVQMLYGIQWAEQERLAREGYRCMVLVSYGSHWDAWVLARLGERPANLWFLVRNAFG